MWKKTGKGEREGDKKGEEEGVKGKDMERRGKSGNKSGWYLTIDCSGDDSSSLRAGQQEAGEAPPPAHSLG